MQAHDCPRWTGSFQVKSSRILTKTVVKKKKHKRCYPDFWGINLLLLQLAKKRVRTLDMNSNCTEGGDKGIFKMNLLDIHILLRYLAQKLFHFQSNKHFIITHEQPIINSIFHADVTLGLTGPEILMNKHTK